MPNVPKCGPPSLPNDLVHLVASTGGGGGEKGSFGTWVGGGVFLLCLRLFFAIHNCVVVPPSFMCSLAHVLFLPSSLIFLHPSRQLNFVENSFLVLHVRHLLACLRGESHESRRKICGATPAMLQEVHQAVPFAGRFPPA